MKTKIRTMTKPNQVSARNVRIEVTCEGAQAVFIAGTFNDWRPEVTPMISLGDGKWVKELSLVPGSYEYRFVADGKWFSDPKAKQTPNRYGSFNSVLIVGKKV